MYEKTRCRNVKETLTKLLKHKYQPLVENLL